MMLDWIHACDLILEPLKTVDLERHTPVMAEWHATTKIIDAWCPKDQERWMNRHVNGSLAC